MLIRCGVSITDIVNNLEWPLKVISATADNSENTAHITYQTNCSNCKLLQQSHSTEGYSSLQCHILVTHSQVVITRKRTSHTTTVFVHYSQPVLPTVKMWTILSEQSFTTGTPLLTANGAFGLEGRQLSSPQRCYPLHLGIVIRTCYNGRHKRNRTWLIKISALPMTYSDPESYVSYTPSIDYNFADNRCQLPYTV